MMLRATALGRVLSSDDGPDWMASHASYATPIELDADTIRVFFVSRDDANRGAVGWIDVKSQDPRSVIQVCDRPVLIHGQPGTFDDRGISLGHIVPIDGRLWLYYMGWNTVGDGSFRNSIGLAISTNLLGTSFERFSIGPILDRNRFDAYTLSYPYVRRTDLNWLMYYGSSKAATERQEDMQHILTCATSSNGREWMPTGRKVIGLEPGEYGLSRPWLADLGGRNFMLYSIRRAQYTIGVSQIAPDGMPGKRVTRDLLAGGTSDWDGEATCYPAVINIARKSYLFYSGNGYGRTGFGVAELTLESD